MSMITYVIFQKSHEDNNMEIILEPTHVKIEDF